MSKREKLERCADVRDRKRINIFSEHDVLC